MVSVIIPAFNAEKTINSCLASLINQDYKGETEIIVIDDGSTDSTPDIVSTHESVKLIRQKNAGPASARNAGASAAKGDIILFTDSDCVPEPDWITEMLTPFHENRDVAGVKGIYKTHQRELTARFVQLEYEDKYDYMLKERYIDFIDTYSAGFKKSVFLEMKGYDTDFPVACAEDVELSYRLSNKGYKMVFNSKAIVYHIHPDKLAAYLKKKYKFAYWRMLALKKNPGKAIKDSHTPQMMKLQVLFPPLIIGSAILSLIFKPFSLLLLPLFILFFLTTIPYTVKACKRDFAAGVASPVLLLLRAAAQFSGVVSGIFLARNES